MEQQKQPMKFNDLTKEFLEDFISKMSKEDKLKLKNYIEDHPRNSSSALFVMVKSYIYNYYFRSIPSKQTGTFADTLEFLLNDANNEDADLNE